MSEIENETVSINSSKVRDNKKVRDYKVILIGDTNVGKTTLVGNLFSTPGDGTATIGAAYHRWISPHNVRLNIWDTGGHERYRALTQQYYRNTDICIIAFDLSEVNTFENIKEYWLPSFVRHCNNFVKIYLVGTKLDLRINSYDSYLGYYQRYAQNHGFKFITTTYQEPEQAKMLFNDICEYITEYEDENGVNPKRINNKKDSYTLQISESGEDDEDDYGKYGCWGKGKCVIL